MTAAAPPFLVVVERGAVAESRHGEVPVPWWSFTKTVLAAAALALVRNRKLDLDTPLPSRPYTLRQLLQHRAGVTNYGGLPAYHEAVARRDEPWSEAELLERTGADRLIAEPGSTFAYSNIGYLFVRRLIEETTGKSLAAALAGLVLQPLDIADTRLLEHPAEVTGIAQGYDPRWVYHGLLVGPLQQAALLLDRLAIGDLLPTSLRQAMFELSPLSFADEERPWKAPGYGLGVMGDTALNVAGHTGGGPESVVAVYRAAHRTAAAFALGADQGFVERAALSFRLPDPPQP